MQKALNYSVENIEMFNEKFSTFKVALPDSTFGDMFLTPSALPTTIYQ